jgi:hypothetical protein
MQQPFNPPKNKVGRPPAESPPTPPVQAVVDVTVRYVPPMMCVVQEVTRNGNKSMSGCGRGMQPLVKRWRPGAALVADCVCPLCGAEFVYTPALVRQK